MSPTVADAGWVVEGISGPGYSAARMLGATDTFATHRRGLYLRGMQPTVVKLSALRTLSLNLGKLSGPPRLGQPAWPRHMRAFNPSIAPAPDGLCLRCAYVVALRVDALHQCDRTSPLLHREKGMPLHTATGAFFKGTALAVLDASLSEVLGWTWFIGRPVEQLAPAKDGVPLPPNASSSEIKTANRWQVPLGAADGFAPPWSKPLYDARLFSLPVAAGDGCPPAVLGRPACGTRLLITYNCKACHFSVSHLQLTAEPTANGGLHSLRAWAEHRLVPAKQQAKWLQGRNQALFSVPAAPRAALQSTAPAAKARGARAGAWLGRRQRRRRALFSAGEDAAAGPLEELMVQPWLGMVGSLGSPRFAAAAVDCVSTRSNPRQREACAHTPHVRSAPLVRIAEAAKDGRRGGATTPGSRAAARRARRAEAPSFGANETGQRRGAPRYGEVELLNNGSAQLLAALDLGGPRLSTTANLLRVHRAAPAPNTAARCEAYLGIGHLHRGEGHLNLKMKKGQDHRGLGGAGAQAGWRRQQSAKGAGSSSVNAFMFGFEYTHFFYTLSPTPPHELLATSAEFCIGSLQDEEDCESVQFISGLAWKTATPDEAQESPELVLSYGVNDCESRLGFMGLASVWSMLTPLPGAKGTCVPIP